MQMRHPVLLLLLLIATGEEKRADRCVLSAHFQRRRISFFYIKKDLCVSSRDPWAVYFMKDNDDDDLFFFFLTAH